MVDQFNLFYSRIKGKSKTSSLKRFLLRIIGNILIPLSFLYKGSKDKRGNIILPRNKKVVVSLTTFPKRINRVWIVIECLLRQTVKADIIILYLSKEQFKNGVDDLPRKIRKYHSKGCIKIEFVEEDFRSHKKYFYAFKSFPNDLVITVDDDIFYPTFIIEKLLKASNVYPDTIICTRGYEVIREDDVLTSYKSWKLLREFRKPTLEVFHTSGGGTLYPVNLFCDEIFNSDLFSEKCLHADDVWLNFMAQLNKIKTVKTDDYIEIFPILYKGDITLKSYNVGLDGNDLQIRELLKHFNFKSNEVFKD